MTTSRTSPNLFLFTEPRVGERHGYYDGWEGPHFHYTGMGQSGDQEMRDANRALRDHENLNRVVRLFRASGTTTTYLGEFTLDESQPFYRMDAPQAGAVVLRQVIVFKLVPVGRVLREERDNRRLPPEFSVQQMAATLEGGDPLIAFVPVEQQHTSETTAVSSPEPRTVKRREQRLVLDYTSHMEARGSTIRRLEVVPRGEAGTLRNDIFDTTRRNLIEAKGTGSRETVRMALGQILDYGRFVPDARRGVLLPTRPRPDLERLLLEHEVHAVWPQEDGFADNAEGLFT
jgi:hypothetical protein